MISAPCCMVVHSQIFSDSCSPVLVIIELINLVLAFVVCTADATSMYTNIDTKTDIQTLRELFTTHQD
jgi:hypothetical protein